MGKISQYTRALKAKLTDMFVVASSDNGSLSTKAVTTEQIGDAIITEQTFSGLDGKTPASAIADNTDSIGALSALTTSVKSSLVGAVNEVVEYHEYDITAFMVNLYNQIINTAGTTEFKLITIGKVGIINCRFATSSAITSGVGNIPDVPEAKDSSEFRGAISSRDNKSGFIQYSGKTIVIRCDASTNVMAGQVIFALK